MRTATLLHISFRIRAARLPEALDRLRAFAVEVRDYAERRNTRLADHGHPPEPLPAAEVESVEAAFRDVGYAVEWARDGALVLTGFSGSEHDWHASKELMEAVARQVDSGSELRWELEDTDVVGPVMIEEWEPKAWWVVTFRRGRMKLVEQRAWEGLGE